MNNQRRRLRHDLLDADLRCLWTTAGPDFSRNQKKLDNGKSRALKISVELEISGFLSFDGVYEESIHFHYYCRRCCRDCYIPTTGRGLGNGLDSVIKNHENPLSGLLIADFFLVRPAGRTHLEVL